MHLHLRRWRTWLPAALPIAVALGFLLWHTHPPRPALVPAVAASPAPQAPSPATTPSSAPPATATIAPHSTVMAAFRQLSLDAPTSEALLRAARPVYNLALVQAGHTVSLTRTPAGALATVSYQIDANRTLNLLAPVPPSSAWTASIATIPYEVRLASVTGTITSSLFGAVEAAGEQDGLAIELADIFGWDLDFYTDPRQGDVFRVLIDKKYLRGKFAGYGQVVAAEYVNAGKAYDAVRFHDDLGLLAYYRPNGEPMKREFLRSPLKFAARISSGFSRNRYHPILKIYRPHLGTDFAAPTGTPVQSIGNGTVIFAGRKGEDGNLIQIRHANGYETLYMHLSRILVHVGQHVVQGQRVGLVGMTGLATGPHLDFRIEQNGQFENFETLRLKLPPAAPVTASLRPAFDAVRDQFMPRLEKLQPAPAPAAGR